MKKLLFVLFVVFFAATSVYAVDFQTSGMYEARGTWISNGTGLQNDDRRDPLTGAKVNETTDYGYYDHELDMTTRIVVDDNTKIVVNYEIHDESWLRGNTDGTNHEDGRNLDDNIEFKRVFSSYTFTQTGTTVDLGLMTGGAWAYSWADTGNGRYRVKVTQATPIGPIIGILEKNAELGSTNSSVNDSEKDDSDAYYLAMVTKLGPVNVKPLLGYIYNSAAVLDQGSDGVQMFLVDLGVDGAYDGWGFETEFQYKSYSTDVALMNDYDLWGMYAKVWGQFGPANVYGIFAYGNEDEGIGFGMGDDFEPLQFLAYQTGFGGSATNDFQFAGSTLGVIGIDYAATDALSFNAAVAYVDSNMDTGNFWDGATAWEVDLGLVYKISDAIKYDVGFGYADIDLDNVGELVNGDPDGAWRLYHRFKISF